MKKLLTCLALSLVAASSYAALHLYGCVTCKFPPTARKLHSVIKEISIKYPPTEELPPNSLRKPHMSVTPSGHRIVNKLPSPVTAMVISTCLSCRPMAEQPGVLPPIRLPKYRQPSPPTATISCSRPPSKTLPTVPCSLPQL